MMNCVKVEVVRRVSDRMMAVVLVFEKDVLRLNCGYGRSFEEKQSVYDELKGELDMHSADDLFIWLGDFNGYIGRHNGGFYWVNGRYGAS